MTPTARTLKWLRDRNYVAGVVERYNSFTRRRHDLFGWIDIIAIRGDEVLGVQTTTAANLNARMAKAKALPEFRQWVRGDRKAMFIGWKRPTKCRRTWEPKIHMEVSSGED